MELVQVPEEQSEAVITGQPFEEGSLSRPSFQEQQDRPPRRHRLQVAQTDKQEALYTPQAPGARTNPEGPISHPHPQMGAVGSRSAEGPGREGTWGLRASGGATLEKGAAAPEGQAAGQMESGAGSGGKMPV